MSAQTARDLRAAARELRLMKRQTPYAAIALATKDDLGGNRWLAAEYAFTQTNGHFALFYVGAHARCALEAAASLAAPPIGSPRVGMALSRRWVA